MRVKRWLLAGIALCLLTGMRDPFKPPEDLCRISELSQWRYQGMVGRGERRVECEFVLFRVPGEEPGNDDDVSAVRPRRPFETHPGMVFG